ncbi:MAG TPA: DUF4367 domain-containing protein [Anaerovoracaceae bacterium]|nr:DUF4367 domain-containing protein [Anaerovoracaceae bacterium]
MNQGGNDYDKDSMVPGDSFFAAIGKAAEEEMLKECELWEREAGDIKIPEKVESQILTLARKLEKKQLNMKRNHFIKRFAKTAAVIVILVTVSFTVLFASADALRGKFFDFIFQNSGAYTKVIPVETSDPAADVKNKLPSDWKGVYYPDYMPEGYQFAEAEAAGSSKTIAFQNNALDVLLFTQEPSEGAEVLVDKEGVETGETIIQGNSAFWTLKEGETTLMWNQYGFLFMLYGPLDLDEMIKIAEHLLYIN